MTEETIFAEAIAIGNPMDRAAFLERACRKNPDLRRGVEALLAAHFASNPLDQPAVAEGSLTQIYAPPSEKPGAVIGGRYKLLEEIGAGGMGAVWVAEQLEPVKRKVALKLIKPGMDSRAVLARFEAERQALALMDHPNIAKVLDGGLTETGRPFFVMEYVKGTPITDYCDANRLSVAERLQLFILVCQAVQHAHQKGIIHRDLKPSNILVAPYDGKPVPKVIDFGLAKAMHQSLTDRTLHTAHDSVLGTPLYMSPEQAQLNNFDVDTRADIYSLGVLLYELLTGTTPLDRPRFKEAAWDEMRRIIREEEPPRPSARLSSTASLPSLAASRQTEPVQLTSLLRGELDWIVMKALEKERGRRYETATDFAADVARYLAGDPVQAAPPSVRYRLRKFVRRHRGPVLVTAALAITLVLGTIGTAWGWREALWQRDAALQARLDEAAQRSSAEKLAKANKQLADEADERRERAEHLAVMARFDSAYHRYGHHPAEAMTACAPLLASAARLEDRAPEQILRAFLGAWNDHTSRQVFIHDGPAYTAVFSPDGKSVLTASGNIARLWDVATGKPLGPLLEHQGGVVAAAFSPDGKSIVTAGGNTSWNVASYFGVERMEHRSVVTPSGNSARLWDAATGKPLGPPLEHQGPVFAAAFSPDGKSVVTASADKTARLWDSATGQPLGPPLQHKDDVNWGKGPRYGALVIAAAFSPDGKSVVTASWDGTARLWDSATGKELGLPLQHKGPVVVAAFSPDGKSIVTASGMSALLWDTVTGKALGPPLQHGGRVLGAAFRADGKRVVTASADNKARLWDGATGKELAALQHQGDVFAAAFSPDSKSVVTASRDKTARLWDTASGKPLGPPLHHRDIVFAAAFSPDGKSVITASWDHTARLWDATSGKPLQHQDTAVAAFSPDGKSIITAGGNTARLWDSATGQPLGPPLTHQGSVEAAAFSPDGKRVVTATIGKLEHVRGVLSVGAGSAQVWDCATGKPLGPPLQHQGGVFVAAFSPDGKSLVTTSGHTARLWDGASGKPLGPPLKHRGPVVSAAFSPDGKYVVTGSGRPDNSARLWDSATGKPLGLPPLQHEHQVVAAFSPDGQKVVTASWDHTARLWDSASGQPLSPPLKHQGPVGAPAFSPDGKSVATASQDKTARLWDCASGKPLGPPLQHQGSVFAAAFSPDGKSLATASSDGTARLWDCATSKPLGPPLQHRHSVLTAAFSRDGKRLVTASWDGTARLWQTPRPIQGTPEHIVLWCEARTGLTLDEHGDIRVLDAKTWHERRESLEKSGGR